MKKILTIMALATVMGACNNSADSSTTPASGTDTLNKTGSAIPPPVPPVDTSSLSTDSAKARKAMRK